MAGLYPVSSRAVTFIGYDNGNLTVQWRSGHRTTWTGVPARIWQGLQAASSKGGFIAQHLKGKYSEA